MTVTSNCWHLTYTWHDSTLQYTCTHVRQHGLSKPCKTSLTLGLLWWDQLFDMLVMVKLVSWCQAWSYVMVCMHIMVTSCWSECLPLLQQCIGSTRSSNSSANMCMVFLGMAEPETHWCIVSMMISKCVLVIMCINLPKYMFSPSWACFLSSLWWMCWMGWIACVRSMTCMLLDPLHVINNIAHHICSVSAVGMDP